MPCTCRDVQIVPKMRVVWLVALLVAVSVMTVATAQAPTIVSGDIAVAVNAEKPGLLIRLRWRSEGVYSWLQATEFSRERADIVF